MSKIRNHQIAEEAADWAITLDAGDLTPEQNRALADWLLESPRHGEELLIAASIYTGFEGVDVSRFESLEDLLQGTHSEIIPLLPPSPSPQESKLSSKPAPQRRLAMAAAILFLIMGAAVFSLVQRTDISQAPDFVYTTQTGEQRSIALDDGSIIHINTQSNVEVSYTENERVVTMAYGEAMFEVAHDPNRPFQVIAGDTVAEAIGTTFNVFHGVDRTTVAVIEGKVALETPHPLRQNYSAPLFTDGRLLLDAGDKADVAPKAQLVHVEEADLYAISSWRSRKLVFESEPLSIIVSEFNRYTNKKIIIADDQLAMIEFSGVFDTNDQQSLIAFLKLSKTIHVDTSRPDEIRLSLAE